jgi:hypothetical protein
MIQSRYKLKVNERVNNCLDQWFKRCKTPSSLDDSQATRWPEDSDGATLRGVTGRPGRSFGLPRRKNVPTAARINTAKAAKTGLPIDLMEIGLHLLCFVLPDDIPSTRFQKSDRVPSAPPFREFGNKDVARLPLTRSSSACLVFDGADGECAMSADAVHSL